MTGLSSRPPKAAMLVAQRIVRDAVRGNLEPGELLPPERAMLEKYETGRGTLREALRLLEFQGVLTLKPGPGGGPVLRSPTASNLASTLMLMLQLNRAPYRVIVEVRNAVEPMISQLAAKRMTQENLAEIAGSITLMRDNIGDRETFLESNKQFHEVIAFSSGNTLFAYLIDSFLDILDGGGVGIDYPKHRRVAVLRAHEQIYESLAAGNASQSEDRMREHIEAFSTYVEKKFPKVLDEVISWNHVGN